MGTKYLDQLVPTISYNGLTTITATDDSAAANIVTFDQIITAITNAGLHKIPMTKEFYSVQDLDATGLAAADLYIEVNKVTNAIIRLKKYNGRFKNLFIDVTIPTVMATTDGAYIADADAYIAAELTKIRTILITNFRIAE